MITRPRCTVLLATSLVSLTIYTLSVEESLTNASLNYFTNWNSPQDPDLDLQFVKPSVRECHIPQVVD